MKNITVFPVLLKLARELSKAEKHGIPEQIYAARKAHDEYRDLCLKSDEMITGLTYNGLDLNGR